MLRNDELGMTSYSPTCTERDGVALVSRLYGPGATLAWHLVVVSIASKWLLHPSKKPLAFLDIDLAASLMLPIKASVDFILVARALLKMSEEQVILKRHALIAQAQVALAMQLPFNVLEVFVLYGAILSIVALFQNSYCQLLAIAAAVLFCFVGECYLHFYGL